MTPDAAIRKLEDMQKQIIHGTKDFGEMAKIIREARRLIENIGWPSANRNDIIRDKEKWLRG